MDKLSFLKELRSGVAKHWTPYMVPNRYNALCEIIPGPGCIVQQINTIQSNSEIQNDVIFAIHANIGCSIGRWNDTHTKQDVLALIDRLIVQTIEKESEAHVPAQSPKLSTVMEDAGSIPAMSTI